MYMEDRAMTCDEVVNEEIVEKYLLDELREETRDAFEQHYFECNRCFELLQTYRAMQAELDRTREAAVIEIPRRRWTWMWTWAPAMAVLLVAVSVGLWLRPMSDVPLPPAPQPSPAEPTRPPDQPVTPPPAVPPPAPTLAELARVDPPVYRASRLRGADEATARFEEAMAQYQKRNWAAAIPGLQAASKSDPEAAHALFFLGVSHLLTGQPRLAIAELGRTIALGESPYLEEAHFYLAKAFLQTGDIAGATKELEQTIALRGEREAEARRLMDSLARVARPGR
jgi:tetratricopeptide (TPR) repeat protein